MVPVADVYQALLPEASRHCPGKYPGAVKTHEHHLAVVLGASRTREQLTSRLVIKATVTLMAAERLPAGAEPDLRRTRRNVLLRGVDIDTYIGTTVFLDSGTGPVLLAVRRAARPCAWMDTTLGPGAQRALRAGGGVRCRPLSDGTLTVGPARFGEHAESGRE
jgi:hypothetical protein